VEDKLYKLSVRALIQDEKGGKVLLAHQEWEKAWETPGGRVREGESVLDAVRRHVRDATGFEAYPEGVIEFAHGKKKDSKYSQLHIIFKVRLDSEKKGAPIEGVKTKWFSLGEIKKLAADQKVEWHDERVFDKIA
jgi:8-oxo-dGTP diphosphatase